MNHATKTHLKVKRTGKVHEVVTAREARVGDVEAAYELLAEDRQRKIWYWEHEVEAT